MKNIFSRKNWILASLFPVAFLSFALWGYAQVVGSEIQMCVRHSGDSYIIGQGFQRQNCGNNEQLITLNIQGPKGDKGDKGDPAEQLRLYDANNEFVGIVLDVLPNDFLNPPSSYSIFMPQFGVFGTIAIDLPAQFESVHPKGLSPSLVFPTTNCSGQGYFGADIELETAKHYIIADDSDTNNPTYVIDRDLPGAEITSQSSLVNGICQPLQVQGTVFKLPVKEIDASYTPPLHVEFN